jgi:hypothetical protein
MAREEPLVRSDGWPPRSASGGGRDWWAHFEFTRINIELIILRKKIEERRVLCAFASMGEGPVAVLWFVAQRPTGRLNPWRTREASSLAKASLTGACPMIRRK